VTLRDDDAADHGGAMSSQKVSETKARDLAGLKGYVTNLATCPDGTPVTADGLVSQEVRPHRPPLPHHPDPGRLPHHHRLAIKRNDDGPWAVGAGRCGEKRPQGGVAREIYEGPTPDITAATSVTIRAVQFAFQRHLSTTPPSSCAKSGSTSPHDLLAADPAGTTVTAPTCR
jgi:hypothetical protein